ncbi:hypothetical protein KI387_023965, partial [Taxus chinensis]
MRNGENPLVEKGEGREDHEGRQRWAEAHKCTKKWMRSREKYDKRQREESCAKDNTKGKCEKGERVGRRGRGGKMDKSKHRLMKDRKGRSIWRMWSVNGEQRLTKVRRIAQKSHQRVVKDWKRHRKKRE